MTIQKIDKTESNDPNDQPICPHCKTPFDSINMKQIDGTFGKRYLYYCVNCKATLGISHRKGFWMG